MDDEFVAAVEDEDARLEETAGGVESEPKLSKGLSSSRSSTQRDQVAAWMASRSRTPCLSADLWTLTQPR